MQVNNSKMEQVLLNYLAKYIQLSEEEEEAILELSLFRSFRKGAILLKEGQYSKDGFFVIKGCIRCYYMVNDEEKTTAFYTESESLTPICATNNNPSEYYISCLEDSIIIVGSVETDDNLFKKFPKLETLCRIVSEDLHSKSVVAFDNFKISSPEQRYLDFLESRPDLVQRVPQYHLASFLGITPQSLSRMRNRLVRKAS